MEAKPQDKGPKGNSWNPVTNAQGALNDMAEAAGAVADVITVEGKTALLSFDELVTKAKEMVAKLTGYIDDLSDLTKEIDWISLIFDIMKLPSVNSVKTFLFVFAEILHHLGFLKCAIGKCMRGIRHFFQGGAQASSSQVREERGICQGPELFGWSFLDLVKLAGVVSSSLIFDAIPSVSQMRSFLGDVAKFARDVHGLSLGASAFSKGYEKICSIFSWAFRNLLWRWLPESWTGGELALDIDKWQRELSDMNSPMIRTEMAINPDLRLKAISLWDEGLRIQKLLSESKSNLRPLFFSTSMKNAQELRELAIKIKTSPIIREDPFSLQIFGEAGVGKSKICTLLARLLLEKGDEDHSYQTTAGIYARASSKQDQYWNGYYGQPAVTFDDVFQFNSVDDPSLQEFIYCKSAVPYMVPQANLADKGTYFTSAYMVSTTNVPYPNPPGINSPEALWRRRNVLLEMGQKDASKPVDDLFENARFRVCHPTKPNQSITDWMDFKATAAYVVRSSRAYKSYRRSYTRRVAEDNLVTFGLGPELFNTEHVPGTRPEIPEDRPWVDTKTQIVQYPWKLQDVKAMYDNGVDKRPDEKWLTDPMWRVYTTVYEGMHQQVVEKKVEEVELLRVVHEAWVQLQMGTCHFQGNTQTRLARSRAHRMPKPMSLEAMIGVAQGPTEQVERCANCIHSDMHPYQHREFAVAVETRQGVEFKLHPAFLGAPMCATCWAMVNTFLARSAEKTTTFRLQFAKAVRMNQMTQGWVDECAFARPMSFGEAWFRLGGVNNPRLVVDGYTKSMKLRMRDCYARFGNVHGIVDDLFANGVVQGPDQAPVPPTAEQLFEEFYTKYPESVNHRAPLWEFVKNFDVCPTWYIGQDDQKTWFLVPRDPDSTVGHLDKYFFENTITDEEQTLAVNAIATNIAVKQARLAAEETDKIRSVIGMARVKQWFNEHPKTKVGLMGVGALIAGFGLYKMYQKISGFLGTEASPEANIPSGDYATKKAPRARHVVPRYHRPSAQGTTTNFSEAINKLQSELISEADQKRASRETTRMALGQMMREVFAGAAIGYGVSQGVKYLCPEASGMVKMGAGILAERVITHASEGVLKKRQDFVNQFENCSRPDRGQVISTQRNWLTQSVSSFRAPDVGQIQMSQNLESLLMNKLRANMIKMYSRDGACLNGVFVRGRYVAFPLHFIPLYLLKEANGFSMDYAEPFFFKYYRNGVENVEPFDPKRLFVVPGKDLVMYECSGGTNLYADISKHFMSEDTLAQLSGFKGVFFTKRNELETLCSVQVRTRANHLYGGPGIDLTLVDGLDYQAPTIAGDCGGLILADGVQFTAPIVGMHVGAIPNAGIGFSEVITREDIMNATNPWQFIHNPHSFEYGDTQGPLFLEDVPTRPSLCPGGDVDFVGFVSHSEAFRQPEKTDIVPSLLFDLVFEHTSEPAVLSPHDPRLKVDRSPLQIGLQKFSEPTLPFRPDDIEAACDNVLASWYGVMQPYHTKALATDDEVVNGNLLKPYWDGLNMESSPGIPWIRTRPVGAKGKKYLFVREDFNSGPYEPREDLLVAYHDRCTDLEFGVRTPTVWMDCLKDERRPLEKVDMGKTRLFNACPVDYTMAFRKYFLAFCAFYYDTHDQHDGSPGIDPESPDWTALARKLRRFPNFIAGDFSTFDGKLDPTIMEAVCTLVNRWYDDGAQNARARRVLFEDIIHSYHQVGNIMYQTHRGNPSGNPLTVILNSVVNSIYMRCVYLETTRGTPYNNLGIWDSDVRIAIYGDDNILSVSNELAGLFNQQTIAECFAQHNIKYTFCDKGDSIEEVYEFHEVTYLKRAFSPHPRVPTIWRAQMDVNTIQELTNWIRNCPEPVTAMYDNLDAAMRFAYFHGEDYFSQFQASVNVQLQYLMLPRICHNYRLLDRNFIAKFE